MMFLMKRALLFIGYSLVALGTTPASDYYIFPVTPSTNND
jgi:hypothetical protein